MGRVFADSMIVRDACRVESTPFPELSRSLELLDLHSIPLGITLNLQGLGILDHTGAHHQPSLMDITTLTNFRLNCLPPITRALQNPTFTPQLPLHPTRHR
jgi:hypothetical protein